MPSKLSKDRLFEIKNQIKMAEAINRDELEPKMVESLLRYTGKHVPKFGNNWDIILNEIYPIIQNNIPATFFRNPRAFLKPRQKTFIAKKFDPTIGKKVDTQIDSQKSARTQEALLNYSLGEINYKREVRKTLADALMFPYGVMWHGYKGDYGMTEEQSLFIKDDMIFVKRISPMRFIKDPSVNMANIDEAKWVGRIIDIPYQDFIEDDKLDIDKKIQFKGLMGYGDKISGNSGADSQPMTPRNLLDYADKNFRESKFARFIRTYEIYLRPTKKEAREGERGKILLICDEQEKPLRESEWSIKAEGFPSEILEFNGLNDALFGISDIDTYKDIADQKNAIINLQLRNAQENSKVYVAIATDNADEEQIEKIKRGEQTILMFPGDSVQGKMTVASGGGQASSELYLIDGRIQRNLEDKSFVTDLKRGFLQSGEESAASVKLRAAGSAVRPAYRQDIMAEFLKRSMKYLLQLLKQFMPIDQAVRIIGSLDLEWSENPTQEEIQADVDVEIDAISMLPENPQEELNQLQQTLMLMVQGITQPEIVEKLKQEGKMINLSPIIEQILIRQKIKDPEVFRNIKPEESQGYVSVEQLRQAKSNVDAALTGAQIPFPPAPEDDHVAKLETYTTIQSLLQKAGQVSDVLDQLIAVQQALLQQLQDQQATPGVKLQKPQTVST